MLRNKITLNKPSLKTLLWYLTLTYGMQLTFYQLGLYNGSYKTSESYLLLFLEIFILFFAFVFSASLNLDKAVTNTIRKIKIFQIPLKHHKFIIIVSLFFGLLFFTNGYAQYRYTNTHLSSQVSPILIITVCLKQLIYCFTFLHFFLKINYNKKFLTDFFQFIIVLIQILTISGVTSSVMLFATILIFYSNFNFFSFKSFFIILIFTPILFSAGYFVKWKSADINQFYQSLSQLDFNYLKYIASRLSNTYYSHMNQFNLDLTFNKAAENILMILNNTLFRIDKLIGGLFELSRPEFQSLNRLNYVYTANFVPNKVSGASPGIIPSFKYLFGPLFGVFFSGIYLNILFYSLFNSCNKKKILILFFSILFFQSVFKSPFQALLIVDSSFFQFIGIFIAIYLINNSKDNYDRLFSFNNNANI